MFTGFTKDNAIHQCFENKTISEDVSTQVFTGQTVFEKKFCLCLFLNFLNSYLFRSQNFKHHYGPTSYPWGSLFEII